MIGDEIISRLMPLETLPASAEDVPETELSKPQERMALWSAYMTSTLRDHLAENDALREELDHTAFVGAGLSRGSARAGSDPTKSDRFGGYQFAVHLL
jgi:hypothetical protein